jgi:hypothetical protein
LTIVQSQHSHINNSELTSIDGHLKAAWLSVVTGSLPVFAYWIFFTAMSSSQIPWKIALAVGLAVPAILLASYFFNRRKRRLYCEGIAACAGVVSLWMMFGSYGYFYFGFAPMPVWIRFIGLGLYLGATLVWIALSWLSYRRETFTQDLENRLYVTYSDCITYLGRKADLEVARLRGPGPGMYVPYWVASTLGPICIGYALVSGRLLGQAAGMHSVLMILSVLCFPLSCGLLGQALVRTVFFHIYLPLKLERKTGKKVILGP